MKLIVAGVGPGDPELVPLAALHAAREADLILAPCPHGAHGPFPSEGLRPFPSDGKPSVAGETLKAAAPELVLTPFLFPMTHNAEARDAEIKRQLDALRPQWEKAKTVFLPVIGDSTLYATGAYLHDVWRGLVPNLELELIPGISAHSLAASRADRFLAMGEEILSVIPCTAPRERIEAALRAADSAALYKPSALGGELREVVEKTGPWREMVRVDRAGLPDERVLTGASALDHPREYLSLLLLWRR